MKKVGDYLKLWENQLFSSPYLIFIELNPV